MSTTNDISNGSSNDASNDRERHSSYLTEAMNDKKQMSKDLKELLTEKFIKNVAFYHIIHDLKERENDFLETDGPLCKKFVSICINNMDNLPSYHRIQRTNSQDAEIYFKAIWDMGLNTPGKGIRHAISVKKTSVYATIADRFKSKCRSILCIFFNIN